MKKTKKSKKSTFLGMPMQWDYKHMFADVWNPKEKRVFPPKRFGIGWSLNFHALLKKAKIIKK